MLPVRIAFGIFGRASPRACPRSRSRASKKGYWTTKAMTHVCRQLSKQPDEHRQQCLREPLHFKAGDWLQNLPACPPALVAQALWDRGSS